MKPKANFLSFSFKFLKLKHCRVEPIRYSNSRLQRNYSLKGLIVNGSVTDAFDSHRNRNSKFWASKSISACARSTNPLQTLNAKKDRSYEPLARFSRERSNGITGLQG